MKNNFLQAIRNEYPNEEVTRLVFADWCLENEPNLENKLRINIPIIDGLDIHPNYGFGHGLGNGSGYGYGFGGNGYGTGAGAGYGNGEGNGYGDGPADGNGDEYNNPKLNMPKLHTNQLIFLPFSFVFCGFVHEHIQPYQFKLTNASLILYHRSSWNEIANNTNRHFHRIIKFDTITIGPQIFHSIDWEGKLP